MRIHVGTCIQRTNSSYCSTVLAFVIHNSNAEIAAAATALQENSKCTQLSRSLHQTRPYNAASVKHAAAFIDQMTVIQLMVQTATVGDHLIVRIFQVEVSKKV